MELTYKQILKRIHLSEACMQYLPEGMNISPLCLGKKDGIICDCFICYMSNAEQSVECKAIRWDIENDSIIECIDAGVISNEENNEISGARQYMDLYPQIRTFAFSETLTPEQRSILQQFISAGLSCCKVNIQEKLKAFFPEFYIWCQPFLED